MAFTEDFAPFFDTEGFGVEAIYTPKEVGSSVTIIAIFDDEYIALQGGAVEVAGSQPRIMYESAKISPKPAYGDLIHVNDTDYTIVEVQPDGTGITTLILELREDGSC